MHQILILALETFPERIKYQSLMVLVNELKFGTQNLRMHQALAFYLKPFPENIYCHFRIVLVNEVKIGTQIS